MGEIWKTVPGYGDYYEVSSLGRIRSLARTVFKKHSSGKLMRQEYPSKILNPSKNVDGHLTVHIGLEGQKYNAFVHHLVLLAFVGPRPYGLECCHNNGIADDNRPENLRWDTHANNNKDRKTHGTYPTGEKHPMSKLVKETVDAIRADTCSGPDAARKYGVGVSQISRIRRGESWAA